VSAEIGGFIETLEERPDFANTLFVITSDHGEGLRSHPHVARGRDHGFHVYESQVLVPLILYHSGGAIPRGRVVEQRVRLLDLMPTLLDVAGVEGPSAMVGRSLVPAIDGAAVDLPERFVVETQFRGVHAIGVYDDTWAYIENRRPWGGTNPKELQRRGEPQDGALTDQKAEHPEETARLRQFLIGWEREHPAVQPTLLGHEIPQQELEQLRALGYIE
jgi:arylsulfatase A-like enzyme